MKRYTINALTTDCKVQTYNTIKASYPAVTQKQVQDAFNKLSIKTTKETTMTIEGEKVAIVKGWFKD